MHRITWAVVTTLGLTFCCTGAAEATLCRDLDGASKAKCQAEVARKCASVSGYWPKRRCEEGVAGGMNVCAKAEHVTTCRKLASEARKICRTISARVNSRNAKAWLAALKGYEGLMSRFKAFAPTMRACNGGKFGCSGPARCDCKVDHDHRSCREAKGAAKKQWASFIGYFHKESIPMAWTYIRQTENGKNYLSAAAKAKETVTKIKEMIALNSKAGLGGNTAPLRGEIAKLEKKQAAMAAMRDKELAKERCPTRGKARGKLATMVREHLSRHNSKVTIAVKRFGLNGRKTKTYRGVRRNIVREHQDSVACVQRANEDGSKECYYIYAKLSRQKHASERKWGAWIVERFHNNTSMLCKNLR